MNWTNGYFSVYPHCFTGSFLPPTPFLPSIRNVIDAMKFSIALLDFWMNHSVIELATPTRFVRSVDQWSPNWSECTPWTCARWSIGVQEESIRTTVTDDVIYKEINTHILRLCAQHFFTDRSAWSEKFGDHCCRLQYIKYHRTEFTKSLTVLSCQASNCSTCSSISSSCIQHIFLLSC